MLYPLSYGGAGGRIARPRAGAYRRAMGIFGGGERRERDEMELRAELERLDALSVDDLAREVLLRLFADGVMDASGLVPAWRITEPFDPKGTGLFPGMPDDVRDGFRDLIEEGIQRLERRGLVFVRITGRDRTDVDLRLTRAGRRALESGRLPDTED